ncbi:MAG: hypothetical protein K0U21_02655 [Proteobacteria bacterium]|nr:hypothetical protein [Pseudomonadota bacterium]
MGDFAIVAVLLLLFFPMLHVLVSARSHGGAKFGWLLAMLFFSWLAYIVFLIVTQKNIDQKV